MKRKQITLTLEELRARLQALRDDGGIVRAAHIVGVDAPTLSRFLHSDTVPPPRLVRALRAKADPNYTMPAHAWMQETA